MKSGVFIFMISSLLLYAGISISKTNSNPIIGLNATALEGNGTEYCGFDPMLKRELNGNSVPAKYKAIEQQVQKYLKNNPSNSSKKPPYVFLPVAVHIIHQNGPENISDAMVQQGIDDLNEAFANLNYYDQGTGVNSYIQFCLANTDPSGAPSTGINRVVSPLTDFTMETQNAAVKALSFWSSFDYVNIWLVNEICSNAVGCGVAGYATFPGAHGSPVDGCVVEARFFGSTKPNSAITAHELGHYLGLYHTFEGGCANNNCTTQGDRVCDTPPDQSTAVSLCTSPPNTCATDDDDLSINNPFRPIVNGGLGDQDDMIINYMDYGDRNCYSAFSQGQADRMLGFVNTVRSSLLANNFCDPICSTPYAASFIASGNPVTINTNVVFTNTSTGGTIYEWLIDGVPFAATLNSNYTFPNVGTYTITLNVTSADPLCFETFEMEVEVTCTAQAAFTPSATSIFVGNSVTFTNNSIGAISYEWIVNNTSVSTGINYTHPFNTPGNIPVLLVANGIACADTTLIYISVNTQEDCENGIDDDGDGYIDCFDPNCVCNESDCSISVLPTNFAARLAWRSTVDLASAIGVPMVGNLNPQVDSMPEIAIITNGTNEILLFQGDGSNFANPDVLAPGNFVAYPATNVGLADVNADQIGELAIVGSDRRIRVFSNFVQGNTPPMTLMATSNGLVQHADNRLSFADFDSDGISEIYSTNKIFKFDFSGPVTLNNVVSGTGAGGVFTGGGFTTDDPSNPVAVDILSVADCGGDPDCAGLELVGGYHIYSVDLDPNDGDPIEMKIQRDLRVMTGDSKYQDGYTVAADLNLDGNLDIAVATYIAGNHMIYVYDKNGLIEEFSIGTTTSAGIMTVANVYDDSANGFANDYPEIIICAKAQLHCFNLNAAVVNPTTKAWWILSTADNSGVTGATVFDFNGDKIYEIVYRDETDLRILYGGPAPFPVGVDLQRNWYTFDAFSRTYDEYPIVADVDNDNESEIIFTGKVVQGVDYSARLQVLESDLTIADPWLPSRSCWNQFGYFGLNINEDLTVPAQQQQHHLEFPAGSGLYPYNNYLAQVPDLDENFDPYLPVADATISIDSADCMGTTLNAIFTICNSGYRPLPDSTPITFYPTDPTITAAAPISTQQIGVAVQPDSCRQITLNIPNPGLTFFCATINDNASQPRPYDLSVDFPVTSILECDYTNNLDHITVNFSTPTLNLGPDLTICQSGVFPLDAGAGFQTYEWQDGIMTQTYTAFTAGTYSVTVSDACGNVQTDEITITMANGDLNGLVDAVLCAGETITVSVPSGYTSYSWLPTIGVDCPTCPTVTITATVDTVYVVTAFDSNNCSVFDSIGITVLNSADVARDTVSICTGESVIIHGNSESIPGDYIDTIAIPGFCDSLNIVTLIVNDNPTISVTPTNTSCSACIGLGDLSVTGGTAPFTYDWSNGATTEDVSGLCEATYTVTVTDANGCGNTTSVLIQSTNTFGVSFIGVDAQVTCNGACNGGGTVTATGGQTPYMYQWGNGATTSVVTGLCAGAYPVTVTDVNGCKEVTGILITQPAAIAISVTLDGNVSCNSLSDGGATATVNGGTPPHSYEWSNGTTTPTVTNLGAGTHSITITDASACTMTGSIQITEPDLLSVNTTVDSNVSCSGVSDGGATATVTGGTIPYTYQWNNGATTASITNLIGGGYSVTITDGNSCLATAAVNITGTTPLSLGITGVNTSCTACIGTADATVSGGLLPYIYQWSNSATTQDLTGLCAGIYNLTVTDSNGCSETGNVNIGSSNTFGVSFIGVDNHVTCNGGCDGAGTVAATGGLMPYTYQWGSGHNGPTATGLCAGAYPVTVTDANNCKEVTGVVITEPSSLNVSAALDNNACNGLSDGGATISASGGTIPYNYQWSNGATTTSITNLANGTYSATVTDGNGCTETASVNVLQPELLISSATIINFNCLVQTSGNIIVVASGGTTPYTYLWSDGQSSQTINGVPVGTYTVTVTDINGCQSTTSATIEPPFIVATTATPDSICSGQSSSLQTTTGALSYSWTPTTGLSDPTISNPTASPTMTTTYYVDITNNGGNLILNGDFEDGDMGFTTAYVQGPVPGNPLGASMYSITTDPSSVHGGFAPCNDHTTGTGNQMVLNGSTTANTNLWCQDVPVLMNTDYDFSAWVTSVYTSNPPELQFSINNQQLGVNFSPPATTCDWTQFNETWNSGTNTIATICIQELSLVSGGNDFAIDDIYFAPICNYSDSVTIYVSDPQVLINSVDLLCNGLNNGSASATVSNGHEPYAYEWSNGNTTANITGITAGTYTLTVSDVSGCIVMESVTITEPSVLLVSASVNNNVSCNGLSDGGATATATGGTSPYSYQWNNGETTPSATMLDAGTHSVTITDANSCTSVTTLAITESAILSAAAVLDNSVSCNGLSDGGATVSATGGTVPYTYQWNNGETTPSATMLNVGTHSVTVTDANNCTAVTTITISEPAILSATAVLDNNVRCNGLSDGGATVSATGGTVPYTYQWNNGETTPSATMLDAGNHSVTVTDANNCTAVTTVSITEPTILSASSIVDNNVSCNGLSDGEATVSATGGTVPYTYQWNNGETTPSATMLEAGTHSVTITDANNCTSVTTVTITEPAILSATAVLDNNVSCNGLSDGGATVSATGGTVPYTYQWNNGETTPSATMLDAGNHSVTVIDANNCTTVATVTITEPTILSASSIVDNNVSCNGLSDGGATVSATGGTVPYTYQWNNGETTPSATMLDAGTHSVTITDANNCTSVTTVTITESAILSAAAVLDNSVSCNGLSDGEATVSATGGTVPYTYQWNNGETTPSATMLNVGTHSVTVTDANNCTAVTTVTISEPSILTVSTSVNNNVSCNGLSDGSATANGTGGTPPYGYQWDSGEVSQTATMLDAGTHSVTITDANSCTSVTTLTITEPAILSATAVLDNNVSCNGLSDGGATVSATGGTVPYTYQWDSGEVGSTATMLDAGIHLVTITDANNCTAVATIMITEPQSLNVSVSVINNVSCNGLSDGSATVTIVGGTSPFTYVWNNGEITSTATGLAAGTNTVSVTDGNGCTTNALVLITEPTVLISSATTTNVSCNGGSNGGATIGQTGGTSPYSYNWSNGQLTAQLINATIGNYGYTVTDSNGCESTGSVTITEPTALNGSLTVSYSNCSGHIDLQLSGGVAPYTYSWSNGATTEDLSNLPDGVYTVVVVDNNGCSWTGNATVVVANVPISTNAVGTNVLCNGNSTGSINLTILAGNPPYSIDWDNAPDVEDPTGLPVGTYTVTVTDATGCTGTSSVVLTEPLVLTAIALGTSLDCNGDADGAINLAVNGGVQPYSFNWDNAPNVQNPFGLTAGNYNVTVTDANGCIVTTGTSISEPTALTGSIATSIAGCAYECNGSATYTALGGTPPYAYLWSDGQITSTAINLCAGGYTVSATDGNGCVITQTFTIAGYPAISANTNVLQPVICSGDNNGVADVSITGGVGPFTILWSSGSAGTIASGLVGGTYTVMITDANGCVATSSAVLTDPSIMTAVIASTGTLCTGNLDGTATATTVGGIPPYTYVWDNGETNNPAILLGGGSHMVSITDSNGCTIVESVSVNSPTALGLGTASTSPPSCNGVADGSATVQGTGGTAPYTYIWDSGQSGPVVNGLQSGVVNVTITDSNGCTFPVSLTVANGPTAISLVLSGLDPLCFGGDDGTVTIVATGGTPSYTYQWNTGSTAQTLFALNQGSYTVTVTDQNGCSAAQSITLTHPTATVASLQGTGAVCYGESNGGLSIVTATGGTGNLEYSLDGIYYQTDSIFNGLSAGQYTVYIRDDNGCVTEFIENVLEPAEIVVDAGPDIEILLGDSIQLDATTNHPGPVVWTWNNGEFLSCTDCPDPWVFPMESINYEVMVLDTNGCEASDDISIIVNKNRDVFIPNAFTPNGDGVNDLLYVFGDPSVSNIRLFKIFDRWGEQVFSTENVLPNDPTFGWDGQFKGQRMNGGVFVYYVEVAFIDGETETYKGSVTLLR